MIDLGVSFFKFIASSVLGLNLQTESNDFIVSEDNDKIITE